eukprot:PITA_09835
MRGLNSPSKHRMLKTMIQLEKPAIVFLQETKSNNVFLEKILRKSWPDSRSVSVDGLGTSGGLAIVWNPQSITLQDLHASRNFIQASFHILGTEIHGLLTNTYFPQDLHQKLEVLEALTALNANRQHPLWISGGDYNIITSLTEKKRRGPHHITSRLDRFLISDNAIHLGGALHASILPQGGSDHLPIMLQWTSPCKYSNRPFRFESFWFTNPDFKGMVQDVWKSFTPPIGAKMYQFQQKLRHLKQAIKAWNKSKFGNILDARKNLEQNMCDLQQTIITEGRTKELANKEHSLWMELEARRLQEEILWKQKSRIRWLKEGEKNTKLFHRSTIQLRMHNNIAFINNSQGDRIEKHEDIEKAFRDHFQEALKEQPGSREAAIKAVTQHVPKIITEDQNQNLLKQVTMQEVEEALTQLKDGKAPGPDGFTANFFHEFWDLISSEVWALVEESRSMHWVLPSLNSTFISLVPKGEEANTPDKFRPVALCNVIYKLISKVVANRLKPLLPLLILSEQAGYVEGRQIMDGIILSNEVIHSLKILKKPGMMMKLDLSKAFEKLSWDYIQQILLAFGFSATWTRWIMNLISSPCFSVLLNGSPSMPFRSSRGIRQGDPLSPFIFILMAEGLSRLLHHAVSSKEVKGLALHGLNPLSHQEFVDNTILFGHSSSQEAKAFKSLLSLFSEASGTSINSSKSQLFFFNTPVSTQRNIA